MVKRPAPTFPHPAIYVGESNSHNQLQGYEYNDADGNRLLVGWRKGYTPDLSIVTHAPVDNNTLCNRYR
jgi:hypothetical protein